LEQAKEFYEKNKNHYMKPTGGMYTFEEVKPRVMSEASAKYRLTVADDLAKALIRDRFPMTIYEKNLQLLWTPEKKS